MLILVGIMHVYGKSLCFVFSLVITSPICTHIHIYIITGIISNQ